MPPAAPVQASEGHPCGMQSRRPAKTRWHAHDTYTKRGLRCVCTSETSLGSRRACGQSRSLELDQRENVVAIELLDSLEEG